MVDTSLSTLRSSVLLAGNLQPLRWVPVSVAQTARSPPRLPSRPTYSVRRSSSSSRHTRHSASTTTTSAHPLETKTLSATETYFASARCSLWAPVMGAHWLSVAPSTYWPRWRTLVACSPRAPPPQLPGQMASRGASCAGRATRPLSSPPRAPSSIPASRSTCCPRAGATRT